jgi:hypothetical protein
VAARTFEPNLDIGRNLREAVVQAVKLGRLDLETNA